MELGCKARQKEKEDGSNFVFYFRVRTLATT